MNEEKISQIFSGTVIFQKINEGSKSESTQPFLYINQNQIIHLFLKDSNPFENNNLQKYDGCNVTVEGYMDNDTFIIHSISSETTFPKLK